RWRAFHSRRRARSHCRPKRSRVAPCADPWRGRAWPVHRPRRNRNHCRRRRSAYHRRPWKHAEGCHMRALFAAVLAITCIAATAVPAREPSAGALAAARDMLTAKGGNTFFDPVVPGVIESVKNSFVPTNPQLSKELNDVAALLRKDY